MTRYRRRHLRPALLPRDDLAEWLAPLAPFVVGCHADVLVELPAAATRKGG